MQFKTVIEMRMIHPIKSDRGNKNWQNFIEMDPWNTFITNNNNSWYKIYEIKSWGYFETEAASTYVDLKVTTATGLAIRLVINLNLIYTWMKAHDLKPLDKLPNLCLKYWSTQFKYENIRWAIAVGGGTKPSWGRVALSLLCILLCTIYSQEYTCIKVLKAVFSSFCTI